MGQGWGRQARHRQRHTAEKKSSTLTLALLLPWKGLGASPALEGGLGASPALEGGLGASPALERGVLGKGLEALGGLGIV